MATEDLGKCMTFTAGESLSSDQFKIVKLDTNGAVIKATAKTDVPVGILQNNPPSGGAASVCIEGKSKLIGGAALTIGAEVGADSLGMGTAITVAAGGTVYNYAAARVLVASGGSAGVTSVLVYNGGRPLLV